jgi:hypothetical protein
MPKYYVKCGTLELIYSTGKTPRDACRTVLWETNEHDTLDEYFYVDERGYRNYASADPGTVVIPSSEILKAEGWKVTKKRKSK